MSSEFDKWAGASDSHCKKETGVEVRHYNLVAERSRNLLGLGLSCSWTAARTAEDDTDSGLAEQKVPDSSLLEVLPSIANPEATHCMCCKIHHFSLLQHEIICTSLSTLENKISSPTIFSTNWSIVHTLNEH